MMTIKDIYEGAQRLIDQVIRKEMVDQGHHLTGAMEDSLDASVLKKGKAELMEGFAIHYTKFVNEGFPAASASYKQAPFLIDYFKKRGLEEKEAVGAAFATIKTWMRDGMPTQASKAYSSTGSRTNMIENALLGASSDVDEYMSNSFDFMVEENFQKEKSETV